MKGVKNIMENKKLSKMTYLLSPRLFDLANRTWSQLLLHQSPQVTLGYWRTNVPSREIALVNSVSILLIF